MKKIFFGAHFLGVLTLFFSACKSESAHALFEKMDNTEKNISKTPVETLSQDKTPQKSYAEWSTLDDELDSINKYRELLTSDDLTVINNIQFFCHTVNVAIVIFPFVKRTAP